MQAASEEQPTRRITRRALTEIPHRLGVLSAVDPVGRTSLDNVQNNFLNGSARLSEGNTLPTTFLSPSPSPDEMIIRQRGRRRIPVTFSPDIDELKRNRNLSQKDNVTPVKQIPSPGVSNLSPRCTPRKRLQLNDPTDVPNQDQSPHKSSPKKAKLDSVDTVFETFSASLKACTSNQLIEFIRKLVQNHPELEEECKKLVPKPDLHPLEVHLTNLKHNIVKALPTNRLCSKTDAIAYHRAATHLVTFKKALLDYGRRLSESKQWTSVADFVLTSWTKVRMIPSFDNSSHNLTKKTCFKFLTTQFTSALKYGNFSMDQLNNYIARMKNFTNDTDDVATLLQQLETKLQAVEEL